MMTWNACRILIAPNQTQRSVASALRRLADLIEHDAIEGMSVVALRTADDQLVGAATLFSEKRDKDDDDQKS